MTEPTRRALHREGGSGAGKSRPEEETGSDTSLLLRWVNSPDGRRELLELPLTREDYLNPQVGDKWVQGIPHSSMVVDVACRLWSWFPRPEFLVVFDVQHLLGRGLPKPSPDVSVIRGAPKSAWGKGSFDVVKQGVVPCLIVEVLSPMSRRIREVDENDKVQIYQQAGVPEYLLLDLPRDPAGRLGLIGYRLDSAGIYQRIVPDEQGRLLCQATGLWFSISPEGDRLVIRDVATGTLLPSVEEGAEDRRRAIAEAAREAEARQAAEEKAAAAEEKAATAETELARLRAEIERLRSGG
ncbi:MAG TPA: Uma2 family endonuclease [Thermoanaerobaculia bacterium]|jgi:Uma2 family endonuclease|nr:Uma2 family endonuclease [Thermoanaerobaculia bacterium]